MTPLGAPVLFHDRGCPFAQRVRALVDHLDLPMESREALVGDKPDGLEAYSSSGAIPLLVHGDLVITESRVMLEHLAEYAHFDGAYPADLAWRTRHRHSMAVTDEILAPLLMASARAETRRIEDALDALQAATDDQMPYPCLMSFHVAPIWLRCRLWRPTSEVTRAIEARPTLCRWLDAAARLESVVRTSPDPETHAIDLERARDAGLMPF
jgi:glutathione S-transferase